MNAPQSSHPTTPPRAWLHLALVFAFMLINYADKAIIGLASVPIMRELNLSHAQFGLIGSAFFFLFALSGIAVGFLANRVASKTLLGSMALVWGLALVPMMWSANFGGLLASRIVLGAAEGPSFPVAMHSVYKWFGDRQRALPSSVVASGAAVGTGVIAPLIAWLIARFGWHTAFGVLGITGFAWAGLWKLLAREGPLDAHAHDPHDPHDPNDACAPAPPLEPMSYARLLTSRTVLGVFIAGFGAYLIIALNVTWLANYLVNVAHLTAARSAWIIALPSLMQVLLAPAIAWLSQSMSARGVTSRIARGMLGSMCVVLAGSSLIVMSLLPMSPAKILLIGIAFSIGSVMFTLGSTLIGEVTPAAQRGALLGITNSVQTLAGLCAPIAMGLIVDSAADTATGFRHAFLGAGALVTALGIASAVLIDPRADSRRR